MQSSTFNATVHVGLFGDAIVSELTESQQNDGSTPVSNDIRLIGTRHWLSEVNPDKTKLKPGQYTITGDVQFEDVPPKYNKIKIENA